MDQVKAHYPTCCLEKKGYEISGDVIYENKNLLDIAIEERAHKEYF